MQHYKYNIVPWTHEFVTNLIYPFRAFSMSVCVCMSVRVCVCVCVCLSHRAAAEISTGITS